MNVDAWLWLAAPVAAGLLIACSLVPLGNRVLARGMVFADLAIAQWAALGSLAGGALLPAQVLGGVSGTSLLSALLAVGLVHLILRLVPHQREAMIGILYVVGASLAAVLVSNDPHGAQALARTLDGDLLWVTGESLVPLAVIALAVVAWQVTPSEQLRRRLFLILFALAVTLTVEIAGIYVVFASLIAAPLMLCHLAGRPLWLAVAAAFVGQCLGLLASANLDLPAGPAVVIAIVLVSLIGLICLKSPEFPTASQRP